MVKVSSRNLQCTGATADCGPGKSKKGDQIAEEAGVTQKCKRSFFRLILVIIRYNLKEAFVFQVG
jgi:hypothetical protein